MRKIILALLAFFIAFAAQAKEEEMRWFPLSKVTRQPKGMMHGPSKVRPTASSMQLRPPPSPMRPRKPAMQAPAAETVPVVKTPLADVPKPLQAEHILAIFPP